VQNPNVSTLLYQYGDRTSVPQVAPRHSESPSRGSPALLQDRRRDGSASRRFSLNLPAPFPFQALYVQHGYHQHADKRIHEPIFPSS
jgi:hypothetical protein